MRGAAGRGRFLFLPAPFLIDRTVDDVKLVMELVGLCGALTVGLDELSVDCRGATVSIRLG